MILDNIDIFNFRNEEHNGITDIRKVDKKTLSLDVKEAKEYIEKNIDISSYRNLLFLENKTRFIFGIDYFLDSNDDFSEVSEEKIDNTYIILTNKTDYSFLIDERKINILNSLNTTYLIENRDALMEPFELKNFVNIKSIIVLPNDHKFYSKIETKQLTDNFEEIIFLGNNKQFSVFLKRFSDIQKTYDGDYSSANCVIRFVDVENHDIEIYNGR